MTNPAQQTAPKQITIAERRLMAVTLRKQGGSYRLIAAQLRTQPGVSPKYNEGQAYKDVMAELNRLYDEVRDQARALRALELERIDEMHAGLWQYAKGGDIASIAAVMRLQDQRAKYAGVFEQQPPAGGGEPLVGADGTPLAPRIREIIIQLHGVEAQAHQQVAPPESEGPSA